jgi:hypothetical protein
MAFITIPGVQTGKPILDASTLIGTPGFPEMYIEFDTVNEYLQEISYWKYKVKNYNLSADGTILISNYSYLNSGQDESVIVYGVYSDGCSASISKKYNFPEEYLRNLQSPVDKINQLVCSFPSDPQSIQDQLYFSGVTGKYEDYSGIYQYPDDLSLRSSFVINSKSEFGCALSHDNNAYIDNSTGKVYVSFLNNSTQPPPLDSVGKIIISGVQVDLNLYPISNNSVEVGTYSLKLFTKSKPVTFPIYAIFPDYSNLKSQYVMYGKLYAGDSYYDAIYQGAREFTDWYYLTTSYNFYFSEEFIINVLEKGFVVVDGWNVNLNVTQEPGELWDYST